MAHIPPLIGDLALILAAAGVVTLLFKRLGQPVVLGYIVAGMLVGPHFSFLPTVTEIENVRIWGEIGVIFLLFALGLEFNFKKLASVGGPASITAVVEVVGMATLGFITGRAFGWSFIDCLFLGGILSISSTTIIIRAFEEVGVKGRGFVSLVFGVLIVEDLIAILLLVLLSTIAVSQTAMGSELALSMGKLGFFLVLWFLAGIFILPTVMIRLRKWMTSETLLVIAISLCFAMVVLSTTAGFSAALGAFVMGSLLSETSEGRRIEHLIMPVKDLFAAVFFVSVGMLLDPKVMYDYSGPIAVITIVTIVGKFLSTAIGVVLAGKGLRHAVQSGMSLAQIGEFSFIIAALGLSLKVTSDFLYPIAVGVSVITTFTTPYMIKAADPFYRAIDNRLPEVIRNILSNYSEGVGRTSMSNGWSNLVRSIALRLIINMVIIAAIFIGVKRSVFPILFDHLQNFPLANAIALFGSLIFSAPFFWAIVMARSQEKLFADLNVDDRIRRAMIITFVAFRWITAIVLFSVLSTQFIHLKVSLALFLITSLIMLALFSRRLENLYRNIESRFVKNLTGPKQSNMPALAPWDAHLEQLEVNPSCELVGQPLESLKIRERFQVIIALIERGAKKIPAPGRHDMLFPHDKIFVIGTDEQILNFRKVIEPIPLTDGDEEFTYQLRAYNVLENSPYIGRLIRDSGIRETTKGLVVGIERKGQRILNPDSGITIEKGDLLWIVGEITALRNL